MVMNYSFEEIFEEGLFQNKETFDEILLRLVLLLDLGERKKKSTNNMSITVDVRDTILPFSALLEPESFHVYKLSLNLSSNSLNCLLQIIEDKDFRMARSLNSVKPYFNLIFTFDHKYSKQIGFEIKDAIVGWNDYFKRLSSINFIPDRYVVRVDLSVKSVVELNRDAEFIKRTDPLIRKLELELRKDVNDSFMRHFGIQYEQFLFFIEVLKGNNPFEICNFLEANFPYNLFKLDLILRIIVFPELEAIDLDEYEMYFDEKLIGVMLKLGKEEMLTVISKFNEMVDDFVQVDDVYDPNKLLLDCLTSNN